MTSKLSNPHIEGIVDTIAFGGQGIVRHSGMVVFIPFVLPGERVLFEIVKKKKNFALGKLIQILTLSPDRVQPLCPYFTTCGGCHFQNVRYEKQLDYKKKFVQDCFERIANVSPQIEDTVPADPIWAYREHVTLRLKPSSNGYSACFTQIDHTSHLAILHCDIFEKPSERCIQVLQSHLKHLDNSIGDLHTARILRSSADKFLFVFMAESSFPKNSKELTETLLKESLCDGVIWHSSSQYEKYGNANIQCTYGPYTFQFSPIGFIQNHQRQSMNIYKMLLERSGSERKSILDLYCGIGISSALLASVGHKVLGIDHTPSAIEMAIRNQAHNQIENVEFLCGDVDEEIQEIYKKQKPDIVVVNPPRTGLSEEVQRATIEHMPKEIYYISCHPATLARDTKIILGKGYIIKACKPFDMFPQTTHVETVLCLERV